MTNDRWISDGKEIKKIADRDKTYEAVTITPELRGHNIINGHVPFLLAMPPEQAKQRYRFKLLSEERNFYLIRVWPNWIQDAVDWGQAELWLDRRTSLPQQVNLHDADGTEDTVYVFTDIEVNRTHSLFWTDPFAPLEAVYERIVPPAQPDLNPLAANRMPTLIGFPYYLVKEQLKTLGYNLQRSKQDRPAAAPGQLYRVAQQQPSPNAFVDKQTAIIITVYVLPNRTLAQPLLIVPSANRGDYQKDSIDNILR
jgi:hypothetical protein